MLKRRSRENERGPKDSCESPDRLAAGTRRKVLLFLNAPPFFLVARALELIATGFEKCNVPLSSRTKSCTSVRGGLYDARKEDNNKQHDMTGRSTWSMAMMLPA